MNILDQVSGSLPRGQYNEFRPATTREFFALRLAIRLGEGGAARHYADLTEQYSEGQLLEAYGRALRSHVDLARRFHVELGPSRRKNDGGETRSRLAAIRIDRRAIAVAVLNGDHLQYADARQLSYLSDKALDSTVSFVTRRVIEKFKFGSAALEIIPNGHERQRTLLQQATIRALSAQAIGILEISKADLLEGFSHPPVRFRKDIRQIISEIYPALKEEPGRPWTQDAAALGLYVQTERLFNRINQYLS